MYKFLIFYVLSVQLVFASGATKLVDFIVSSSGTTEILSKYGIKGSDARLVENYVANSFAALSSKKILTKNELMNLINRLPVTPEDAAVRKELQILLDKNVDEFKKDDVVKAINNIIYLANRHGKSILISCADCVNDNLAKNGFTFSVENLKNSSIKKLLNDVIPNSPKDLQVFISSKMRRQRLGDYSKVTPEIISAYEEKAFALFLALAESGNQETKALIATIKKVSTKDGTTGFFDPVSRNKFWKVAVKDMSSKEIEQWTKALEKVGVRANKEKILPEQAFYRILREKSEGSESLLAKYRAIKSKRCFFK